MNILSTYTLVMFLLLNLIKVLHKQACLGANKKDIKDYVCLSKKVKKNTFVSKKQLLTHEVLIIFVIKDIFQETFSQGDP
jgi:hypothetical protein